MGDLVQRFLRFDKMIGTSLIKVLYYIGIAAIALFAVLGLLGALGQLASAPLAALGGLIMVPIFAVISLLFWRFVCELYIVMFKISDDLTIIRDRTPALHANDE